MLNDYGINNGISNRKDIKSPISNCMSLRNMDEMKDLKLKYQ